MILFPRILRLLIAASLLGEVGADEVDFVEEVRPIFEKHCYSCHGEEKQKSGLRLDVKSAAFRGGDNHGPDIVPGKSDESPLIQFVVTDDEDLLMPPPGKGRKRLSDQEISILTRWVNEGAHWPDGVDLVELEDTSDHWAFKPLRVEWENTSIDDFIDHKLAEKGLRRSREADRLTWLRRVTLDLTGLPPTPEEVDRFLDDSSGNAFETVVERLLASPHYGERWAQHWLDVVRYADTHGFEVNTERAHAWPYRDYVIQSFNEDLPWDQFVREQIAGDAFGKPEATGFLVTAAALLPGQIGKDEESKRLARQDELGEMVINLGEAFLGLSIGCARCHDHKFDPITSRDYYAMQAFFAGVRYGDRSLPNPERETRVKELEASLSRLDRELGEHALAARGEKLRAPVSARANLERFSPIAVSAVRISIEATISDNLHEPFIDEFEVLDPDGENVALIAKATSDGAKADLAIDGVYGNASCWRSKKKGGGTLTLRFPEPRVIQQINWGRDRTGKYPDRLASDYRIEAEVKPGEWIVIADSTNRQPFDEKRVRAELYQLDDLRVESHSQARKLLARREPLVKELRQYKGGERKVFAAQSHTPEAMYLLNRGDPEQKVEEVSPTTLSFLEPVELPKDSPDLARRRALADWIATSENPLTSRVIVNRVWQGHFGTGLVATGNDFGNAGALPSHPELLDWLARDFMDSGWSIKDLHRKIVLSATYRQENRIHSDGLSLDADGRLLWRYPSRRVEAEVIRDSILAISGQLDRKMFGRGYDLFHSRGGTGGFRPVESHQKPEGRRRMIYAYKVRMEQEAVFGAFDCPDAGQSAPTRGQSTTPIQALNLFNSSFTIDLASDFSEYVTSLSGEKVERQVEQAWKLAFGRMPDVEERQDATQLVREHGLPTLARALFNSNEFLFLP